MSKAHPPASASILVVDDDPEIVTMLSTRLSKRGYKVSTANDGHRALELAKRDRPDLMLLDVMMRESPAGKSARSQAGPRHPGIKIVMVTRSVSR